MGGGRTMYFLTLLVFNNIIIIIEKLVGSLYSPHSTGGREYLTEKRNTNDNRFSFLWLHLDIKTSPEKISFNLIFLIKRRD